jgi:hypothetical protein
MNSDLDLRHNEEVIDEFGVSIKYTILLGLIGIFILGGAILFRMLGSQTFNNLAEMLGIFGPLVLYAVLVIIICFGVYLVLLGLFFHFAYRYYLTTERVIESVGLFPQRAVSAEYRAISDMIVRQDFINHMILNTGTLGVNTFGGQPEEVELRNIDNPVARREQLRGLSEAAHEGQAVTKDMLRDLKRQTGMLKHDGVKQNNWFGSNSHQSPESEDVVYSQTSPQDTNKQTKIDSVVEDINEDVIEESDKLRDAQKKLDA